MKNMLHVGVYLVMRNTTCRRISCHEECITHGGIYTYSHVPHVGIYLVMRNVMYGGISCYQEKVSCRGYI